MSGVARHLSGDGQARPTQFAGHGAWRQIVLKPDLHLAAHFLVVVFAGCGHATDSPGSLLHLDLERGRQ